MRPNKTNFGLSFGHFGEQNMKEIKKERKKEEEEEKEEERYGIYVWMAMFLYGNYVWI